MRAAPTLLVGLTIPLAACGGSDTDVASPESASSPGAAIRAAAEATLDAGTAKVTLTVEHTRSEATWGIEAGERERSLQGAVDFEEHLVALEVGGSKRTVFHGAAVYFQDDHAEDKRWRRHDLDDAPRDATLLLARRYDPVHLLRFIASLRDFGPVPDVVGREQIRGLATTHYDGSIENEALARALTPGFSYEELVESEAYPQPISQYTALEAWVGDDGRLYKVVYDWDAFGTLFGERMIVEFDDFGADVEIVTPSPDETVDG